MITQERLKELLHYDPNTGVFTWATKASRNVVVGRVAGSSSEGSYHVVRLDKQRFQAHRLAFLYMTGEWPEHDVDHINGVRTDNRWANLRDITRATNIQNQRAAHSDSAVEFLGVYYNKARRKFVAQIKPQGQANKYIGGFDTAEEAHAAYLNAKRELHAGCTI